MSEKKDRQVDAWHLRFVAGAIVVSVPVGEDVHVLGEISAHLFWDSRIEAFRAEAIHYRAIILALKRADAVFVDEARQYTEVAYKLVFRRQPYDYQREALQRWMKAGACGIVVLPTGAGKSYVAQMAIERIGRSTLVVAPTIDLMTQWVMGLEAAFGVTVGCLGGGSHDVRELTVTTYDSAYLHMEKIGARFGFIIFDEVHHLPTLSYQLGALHCLAPFRMGLSATPQRDNDHLYASLVGPIVYAMGIRDLAGKNLAQYQIIAVDVYLDEEERERYDAARQTYLNFIRMHGIRMGTKRGWGDFMRACAFEPGGRAALKAHREQKVVTQSCRGKREQIRKILRMHTNDKVIIFTADNDTVYALSQALLVPAMTHHSSTKERAAILQAFADGRVRVIVTSRVLNEGVDMPDANVAIILSGSGSVREHVQRLGRILRPRPGKVALLYEIVVKGTNEESTSRRRRQHDAYR